MEFFDLLSVEEASRRLGRSPQAVRLMATSGDVEAIKRGNAWWLDARAVERRRREPLGSGRPLSPAMAWSVLQLASGAPELARRAAQRPHHASRARQWLDRHPLAEHFSQLRARARRAQFDAHAGELRRLLARDDVMPSGISAAAQIGLHGGDDTAEFYAPYSAGRAIIEDHALEAGRGQVLARWVPDELWPAVAAPLAPRAAVLIDLLEHDDPRARREARRALARP